MTDQPTTQAVAVAQPKAMKPMEEVCNALTNMSGKFKEALPHGMSVERFISTVRQGLQTHRDKDKLLTANRQSLYLACMKAAADGLMLDGREAALVVFGTDVAYMPMTQGLVKLARNSGEIKNIEAQVVYANDKFTYIMGVDPSPRHEADWFSGNRGEPVGAWALVTLENGEKIPAILPKNKIMRVAASSKNAYQYDCSKGASWEEWWRKTAVKNVLKYAPRSTELDRALAHDNELSPIDVTPEPTTITQLHGETMPTEDKPKRRTRLAAVKDAATEHDPSDMPPIPDHMKRTAHDPETGEVLPPEGSAFDGDI